MPIDAAGRERLLRMQFQSMTTSYRAEYQHARFKIVTLDDAPVGRLVTDLQPDMVHYVDMALLPQVQGGGLATALMRAVLEEPGRVGIPPRVSACLRITPRRCGFAGAWGSRFLRNSRRSCN